VNEPAVLIVKIIADPDGAVIVCTAAALACVFRVLVTVEVFEVIATPPTVVAVSIQTGRDTAACAGTTDKSPNPSEATAIADTFFNEIVFTIFLSFSRFQAFPGLGWWLKRPPH
jgi:hypothetical protein